MSRLVEKNCVPCQGGIPPLSHDQTNEFIKELNEWSIENNHHLTKNFTFPNFITALEFVNRIGTIAESEGHHPDLYLSWGKVRVETWTHKIDGLTESDFILAAKIDAID